MKNIGFKWLAGVLCLCMLACLCACNSSRDEDDSIMGILPGDGEFIAQMTPSGIVIVDKDGNEVVVSTMIVETSQLSGDTTTEDVADSTTTTIMTDAQPTEGESTKASTTTTTKTKKTTTTTTKKVTTTTTKKVTTTTTTTTTTQKTTTTTANEGTKQLTYELSSDGSYYTCTGLGGYSLPSKIVIPAYYNGKPVKAVSGYGFTDVFDSIKEIVLSEGIEELGRAVIGCSGLKSITIPKSMKTIHGMAFSGCSNLETVYFEESSGWSFRGSSVDFSDPHQAASILRSYKDGNWYTR